VKRKLRKSIPSERGVGGAEATNGKKTKGMSNAGRPACQKEKSELTPKKLSLPKEDSNKGLGRPGKGEGLGFLAGGALGEKAKYQKEKKRMVASEKDQGELKTALRAPRGHKKKLVRHRMRSTRCVTNGILGGGEENQGHIGRKEKDMQLGEKSELLKVV